MAELTINQVIKLILGIVVVVAVIWGVYFAFKNYIFDFVKNLGTNSNETANLILSILIRN